MSSKENASLEIRVGLLVLTAVVIFGGFVFLLGGFDFASGRDVYVDFDNPGRVKPGAPVTAGGVPIGRVEEIEYRGNRLDPATNTRALIRIRLSIEDLYYDTLHEDAVFYVTSQSILGEQIVAVDPGDPEKPGLPDHPLVGLDPPRLDLALALGFELLEAIVEVLKENRGELSGMLTNLAVILDNLAGILGGERERISSILENVDRASEDAAGLAHAARETVEGPEIDRIVRNLDRTLVALARDIQPILTETRSAVTNANETLASVGPEEREQIRAAIHDAAELAERANAAVGEAQGLVHQISEGRGTVGALVMDEAIYDDLQEMLRDVKHNPWKLFWRE
ncbi:MAG: MCE family protein [Deltaproteobacteria bacterium]|nr:MAG: MCE family protein [Deltaproteobacteria bacterium]